MATNSEHAAPSAQYPAPGRFPSTQEVPEEAGWGRGGEGRGGPACSPRCSKPALLSSRPVPLVWALAGSPVKQGQERRRGWMAVQVLRGSQVLVLAGPAPALRSTVVRPSPSRGLRVPSPAARRERSPPKRFLQDCAGGAGLGSGAVPEEEVSGR